MVGVGTYMDELMSYLKELTDFFDKNGSVGYDYEEWKKLDFKERERISEMLRFFKDSGYISMTSAGMGCPSAISIKSQGRIAYEKYMNQPVTGPQQGTSINIQGNNYGVAAHHAHDFTINTTITWNDVRELVRQNNLSLEESRKVDKIIQNVETLMQEGKPLEKGVFNTINDLCQKYTWLSGPIATVTLS